jgi:hypothetical protein
MGSLLIGCVGAPEKPDDTCKPAPVADKVCSFTLPMSVKDEDRKECIDYANGVFTEWAKSVPNWPFVILGPISAVGGVVIAGTMGLRKCEEAIRSCLQKKGYELPK